MRGPRAGGRGLLLPETGDLSVGGPVTFPLRGQDVAVLVPGAARGHVLQLSMRRVHDLVAFCAPYELEDLVAEVTGADRVEITDYDAVENARRVYKGGRRLFRSRTLARAIAPGLRTPSLDREYELFFPVFNHPFELWALAAVPDWRARCRKAICFISLTERVLFVETDKRLDLAVHLPDAVDASLHDVARGDLSFCKPGGKFRNRELIEHVTRRSDGSAPEKLADAADFAN